MIYMFGGLKKKLKEAIGKFVKKEEKEEPKPEIKEEKIEPTKEAPKDEKFEVEGKKYEKIEEGIEKIHEKEKEIEKELRIEPEKKVEKRPEIEPEMEKTIEEEVKQKLDKIGKGELKPGKIPEEGKRVEGEKPEKKPSFLRRIFKKVEEKTLNEKEVDSFLKDLNNALLENDVAFEVAERVCGDVKTAIVGKSVKRGKVEEIVTKALKDSMLDIMKQEKVDIENLIEKKHAETQRPFLIVFFGFNGTGKTTTISKFAHMLKKYKPVIAAGDTFRAASIEQIEEHGRRLGVKVIKHNYGSDSAAVVFDAVKHAASTGSRLVLADTAGRSHSNVNLMDELKKVVRVNKPDMKILVLDSITGNDIYDQSQLFNNAVGVDGMVLTKADVYEKGGSALSASYTIKKPILYLGTGQEYEDLKDFVPEEIVNNLLG